MSRIKLTHVPSGWKNPFAMWNPWLQEVARTEGRSIGELSFVFLSDEDLLTINRQFLDHDYYTDVITFDYNRGSRIYGEVFISHERVFEHAVERDVIVDDERDRVAVHALLHLCGYGDKTREESLIMRSLEDKYLLLRPNVSRGTS